MGSDRVDYRLVRLELPRDRELLRSFHVAYDGEYGFRREPSAHDPVLDWVERYRELYHCLVLMAGEEPVGYMRAYDRISTSSADRVLMLDMVHVLPEWRGRGAGGAMMEGLVRFARENGNARIDLLVDLENAPARALYEKCGFVGRKRFQMHYWLKDHPDLVAYFEEKQARDRPEA